MHFEFTKMHGLGNDFVVIDAVSRPLALGAQQVRLLADRRFGIGLNSRHCIPGNRDPNPIIITSRRIRRRLHS